MAISMKSDTLVDFIAAEHRLRRQAQRERAEVDRWERRAALAEDHGLADLATGARERAERHRRTARRFTRQAIEARADIERLRGDLQPGRGVGRSPPAPTLDVRFADLAIEVELEEIRNRRTNLTPGPAPPEGASAK